MHIVATIGLWVGGVLFGVGLGMGLGGSLVKEEAFQRGYMVECAGVEGYYWECEE